MNIKLRLKSYSLWISLFAFIPMLLQSFGINTLPENYEEVTKAFLWILVMLGLVNNPTTVNKGFLDDEKEENK
jgi:uncharacterized membrane protein